MRLEDGELPIPGPVSVGRGPEGDAEVLAGGIRFGVEHLDRLVLEEGPDGCLTLDVELTATIRGDAIAAVAELVRLGYLERGERAALEAARRAGIRTPAEIPEDRQL